MSTFNGCLEEFPDIRIDYFRQIAGKTPPLVCFLSHIHSDHIQGLEYLRAPFVYCSPATRELLLRLEKYPHRMNRAKGILEMEKRTYRHLKNLLKTIPLNTPTHVECGPNNILQVTLLDANHCAGAVMFLIEDNAKAILYTGDIRSEPWWVNALIRNPVVLPYSYGHKRLDKIYLDTTFATKEGVYQKFPTKAAGISELLDKISKYPKDTIFHLHAWTPGYEDVWVALSSALKSQIHVDSYKRRLYNSLSSISSDANPSHEGPALFGFRCGNRVQSGCLTEDAHVRLHSCEQGTGCPVVEGGHAVYIIPILSRSATGEVILEMGAGGGAGDLVQSHELELDGMQDILDLAKVCSEKIGDKEVRTRTLDLIFNTLLAQKKSVPLDALNLDVNKDSIPLSELVHRLSSLVGQGGKATEKVPNFHENIEQENRMAKGRDLPKTIQFPYSRHSSYDELCELVGAFKPIDVHPCTVDDGNWDEETSVQNLFGHLCSGTAFAHDKEMKSRAAGQLPSQKVKNGNRSQSTAASGESTVGSRQLQDGDREHLRSDQAQSYPASQAHEAGDMNRHPKRRRISPANTKMRHEDIELGQQRLHNIRQSFESHFKREKKNSEADALDRMLEKPIEFKDGTKADEGAGEFLLNELFKPPSVPDTAESSQSSPKTQISLSDAAFESQSPLRPSAVTVGDKTQRRKKAYLAARELGGTWERDHGLVSSFDVHCEEEIEL